ncbi:MAG: phosphatidylserine decarboxylase [Halobacteriovoraceae bacterium]|nr:phosphatidylserine decarboxylase [Halobacteriovoraceae bacterium]
MDINFYNRKDELIQKENVYGETFVNWLYDTKLGQTLSPLVTGPLLSKFYGLIQSSSFSKFKVDSFIKEFNINMDEFVPEANIGAKYPYSNFNSFFIRKFKSGVRDFKKDSNILPAFAEARYFGYEDISEKSIYPVKNKFLSPDQMIASSKWEGVFSNGPLLIARLCPVDYHRFHFPVDGKFLDSFRIHGQYHSVNPIALKKKDNIFLMNERQINILETSDFGKLAYIEVGAICVGKIIQTFMGEKFKRGGEKGYFLFGGSTVILIGEKGKWKPSQDIIENTKKGLETYIQLGDEVGSS